MKELLKKLHSSRGASLIIALLFFLVCIMVSSVVVTAAVANMSRIDKQRDEEQVYLAVFSAARLLQEDFSDMTAFTARKVDKEFTCNYNSDHPDISGVWDYKDKDGNLTGSDRALLAEPVNKSVLHVLKFDQQAPALSFTLTPDAPELAGLPVTVEMTMSKDFVMKFVLSAQSARGSSYTMTLTVTGEASPSNSKDETTYCNHQEQSTTPVLVGGEWQYPVINNAYKIVETTYTTTVVWSPGTISKGR